MSELFNLPKAIMAVGRLDEKSEGLLLLTTDGMFSNYMTSQNIEKEYHVMVDGIITTDKISALTKGVKISVNGNAYVTKPCEAKLLPDTSHIIKRFVRDIKHGPTSWLSITLTEGKYRQVRKMTAAIGYPTLRLVRVRIGNYKLEKLKPKDIEAIHY